MQLASAGYLECIRIIRILNAEAYIGIQLPVETLADVAGSDIFSFLPGQRAVIDNEVHGDRRLGDLLERDGFRSVQRADRIANVKVRDARKGNDGSDGRGRHIYLIQSVEFIELADLHALLHRRVMMVDHDDFLIDADGSAVDLAYAYSSHIFIVIDRADEHLQRTFLISLRSRNVIQDRLKQGAHILLFVREVTNSVTVTGGSKYERAVELLIRSVQIDQKLEHLINDLIRAGFRTVDLVNANDDGKIQRQGMLQNELGLRHGAFKSVNNKDNAVDHFQNALDLTAEIGVAWRIDDVDLRILIKNSRIFRQDGDAALPLKGVGVHNALRNLLAGAENAALLKQLIHQRCLAVIYVSNDRNVSDIFSDHIKSLRLIVISDSPFPSQYFCNSTTIF